jgi:phasin family protein
MKDVPMNSFQAAGFPFVNEDLTRAWSNLKLPPLKIGELFEVHRKNASALTDANQVVFDGLTTLAQRQGELFKTTVNNCSKATYDVLAGASFTERATKQVDAAQHIYVSSVACLRELSDIAVKTNVRAVGILNARVGEALDEFQAMFARPVAPTTSAVATSVIAEPVAIIEEVPAADAVAAEPVVAVVEEAPDVDANVAEPVAIVEEVSAVAAVEPEPTVSAAPTNAPKKTARAAKAARRPTSRR